MALSNIFREPRREIIESVVGFVGVVGGAGLLFLAIHLTALFLINCKAFPIQSSTAAAHFFAVFILIGVVLLLFFTHFVGEEICDALRRRGVELRPRRP